MNVHIATLIVVFTLLSAGCAGAPRINARKPQDVSGASQRVLLIGRWYGEAPTTEGGKRSQITDHCPDGTITVQFHVVDNSGNAWDQTEVGSWGVSGPIYFTIIRGWLRHDRFAPADPTDANLYDAYRIEELTAHTFRYKSVSSGDEFVISRVSHSPTCPDRESGV